MTDYKYTNKYLKETKNIIGKYVHTLDSKYLDIILKQNKYILDGIASKLLYKTKQSGGEFYGNIITKQNEKLNKIVAEVVNQISEKQCEINFQLENKIKFEITYLHKLIVSLSKIASEIMQIRPYQSGYETILDNDTWNKFKNLKADFEQIGKILSK